jgi:hypothetical protein
MPLTCSVPGCTINSGHKYATNIQFHRFPVEKTRQLKWKEAVQLESSCEVRL